MGLITEQIQPGKIPPSKPKEQQEMGNEKFVQIGQGLLSEESARRDISEKPQEETINAIPSKLAEIDDAEKPIAKAGLFPNDAKALSEPRGAMR